MWRMIALVITIVAADNCSSVSLDAAEGPQARAVKFFGYDKAIELTRGETRAIVSPEAGGRLLEFSVNGKQALYLDEQDKNRKPGGPGPITAGRFDFGPELTTAAHPKIWSGDWTAEITGKCSIRLTSPRDEATGVQLVRDFEIHDAKANDADKPLRLSCRQTIINIGGEPREYCHWGRSFSPGGGICLVPLAGRSRFPSKYAMYEDSAVVNVKPVDNRIRERDGFLEILGPPRKPKLGFDSYAGWLAYLMPNNTLFVKRFATFPDRVYSEAAGLTLSVWFPEGPRIELEPIGPRERLQPGEKASFTEDWWLLSFPFPKEGEQIDLKRLSELVREVQ